MPEQLTSNHALTLSLAKKIAEAAEKEARANGWNVVIAIVDDGGNLLYLQRMDGTQIASIEVAMAKAVSSIRYRRPTKAFEDSLLGGRQAVLKLPGAMPVEGGLLLTGNGEIVGAIGVSGVLADQDGIIAKSGAEALTVLLRQ